MRNIFALLVMVAVLTGCGGRNRVVGTWETKSPASVQGSEPKNLSDVAVAMSSALLGGLTLEFNEEGKYKASAGAVGGLTSGNTGTYSVNGNEVHLKPEGDKSKETTFVLDGDRLRLKKEFDSDPDLVFERKPGASG